METQKEFITTNEALNMLRKNGCTAQDFIKAVRSGELRPYWDDGSPMEMEDFEIALQSIEEAQKAH